jgi:two-component system chemotaxis response regulator CheY
MQMIQNILVVDDSETTRAFVRRVLGMCGFENDHIFEAGDGSAALGILSAQPIDLVLADLHMPGMGGLEMTRHMLIQPRLREIPVVIISADPNAVRMEDLRKQGVKGYISKPFTPEAFRSTITEITGAIHA